MSLSEALLSPGKKAAVVADCCSLIDEEVAAKSGISGFAVKAGYGAVKGIKPGFIAHVVDHLLKEFAEALDPIWSEGVAKGDPKAHVLSNRSRVADALEFLRPLRAQNIQLLCDLFHMNIEESDIAAALRLAGNKLGHVHFVDSNRLAPGFGHTDIAPIAQTLREIGYSGYVSAEVLPSPDGDAAARQFMISFRKWFT